MLNAGGLFPRVLGGIDEPRPAAGTGCMDGPIRAGFVATAFRGVVRLAAGVFVAFRLARASTSTGRRATPTSIGRAGCTPQPSRATR